jgi:hypothetical protein
MPLNVPGFNIDGVEWRVKLVASFLAGNRGGDPDRVAVRLFSDRLLWDYWAAASWRA